MILIRLANTGLLPRTSYTEYRHWRDSRKYPEPDFAPRLYRHREPWHIFGDNFVRTVLDAQSARHISLVKAARYLDGLNLKDFHKLERAVDGV